MICPLSPMSSVSQYMPLSEKKTAPSLEKRGDNRGQGTREKETCQT